MATVGKAADLPVTADLEAGYGDAGETARRAVERGRAFLDAGAAWCSSRASSTSRR